MRPQRGCCSSHSPRHESHRSDTGRKVDECEPVAAVGREEKDMRIDSISQSTQPLAPRWRTASAVRPPRRSLVVRVEPRAAAIADSQRAARASASEQRGNKGEWAAVSQLAPTEPTRSPRSSALSCCPFLTDLDPLQESLRLRVVRAQAQARALLTESSSRQPDRWASAGARKRSPRVPLLQGLS